MYRVLNKYIYIVYSVGSRQHDNLECHIKPLLGHEKAAVRDGVPLRLEGGGFTQLSVAATKEPDLGNRHYHFPR